jgi:regulator of sigma D
MNFIKYEKMLMEINEDLSNEIKDIDYKIKFINDNSNIKIKYKNDKSSDYEYFLIQNINENEIEVFGDFYLPSIIRTIFNDIINNCFLKNDIERDNYIKFKKRLDELYDKVKLNVDLHDKLKHKENKKNKEKNIKI